MPRAYNYTHNITINYKETGAKNLGKSIASVGVATDKNVKSINTQNQAMAKSSKSTHDAAAQYKTYGRETTAAGGAQDKFREATDKSTQSQSKWGQSLRQNRGILFGGTGLTSSLVEAAGMYGIYTDALTRKNEAQAEVNRLEAEGLQGTKEYTDAQQELQQQTRAFTMFQRNMALSMFDTVTFVTMLASSLLPRLGGVTGAVTTKFKGLTAAIRGTTVAQAGGNVASFMNTFNPLPAKIEKTTGALGRLKGAMVGLGLSNPFFIAITAIGAILGAVALNVGGVRDRFNELGVELGKTHAFLKPLLDALGSFGELLGGMAGQNNIANATDQYGHLTKEAEAFRAMVIQTDRALMAMFENLSRQEISKMFSDIKAGLEEITNKITFTENPVRKWVEDMIGTVNPELEKGLRDMVALWDLYGDDIMGANMTSKEGQQAQEELKQAMADLIAGGAEGLEENLPKVKEAFRKFFDMVEKEKTKAKDLTPAILTAEETYQNFNKIVGITQQGVQRINAVIQTYLRVRKESGADFAQEELDNIIKANGMVEQAEINFVQRAVKLYEKKKEDEVKAEQDKQEDLMKAVQDGKDKLNEFLEEDKQRELDRNKAAHEAEVKAKEEQAEKLLKIEEQKIKNHLDAIKSGEEIIKRVREKAMSDENINAEQTGRAYERIKQEREYNQALKDFLPTYQSLIGKKEQLIPLVDQLAARYPLLGKSGSEALADLEGMTDKATEKTNTYMQAVQNAITLTQDLGGQIHDNLKSLVGEELFDQGDDKGLDTKMNKDIKRLAEKMGLTKKGARKITIPLMVEFMINNEDEAINSINEAIAILSESAANNIKPKDLTMLNDKYWEAFKKAFESGGGTGVKKKDNAIVAVIDEAMKVDWDDLSPEEAITKLQEIKQKLIDAGFTDPEDEEKKEDPLQIQKNLEAMDLSSVATNEIAQPLIKAFDDVISYGQDMEGDIAMSFEFIASDASTTGTEISTAFTTAFEEVINSGQELEGRIEDNMDTMWEAVDDLISKVEDLSQELEDIPNIHRTVTIERKTIGGGGGGAFFSGGGFDFREGGIITGLARGGIINNAQMYRGIRIGEHNKPEAVVPLSNPKNLAKKALDIDAPINFNLRIDGNRVLRPTNIWETVRPMLGKYQSNFG